MAGNPFLQGASLGEGIVQQGFNTFMKVRDQAIAGQAGADEKKRQDEKDAQEQAAKFMTPLQVLHAKAGFPATMEVSPGSPAVPSGLTTPEKPEQPPKTMTSQEIWGKYGVPMAAVTQEGRKEASDARLEAAAAKGHTPATATMLTSYPKIKEMGFQEGDLVPDRFISEQSKPFAPGRGSSGLAGKMTENQIRQNFEGEVKKEQAKLDRASDPAHIDEDAGNGKKWRDLIPNLATNRDRAEGRLRDFMRTITYPSSTTSAGLSVAPSPSSGPASSAILDKYGLPK